MNGMELAPFPLSSELLCHPEFIERCHPEPACRQAGLSKERRGCQGIIGPLPSAFLDKYIKELLQIYNRPVM